MMVNGDFKRKADGGGGGSWAGAGEEKEEEGVMLRFSGHIYLPFF